MQWSVYEAATGRLVRRLSGPDVSFAEMNAREGESIIEGGFAAGDWYVVDGSAVARPDCPVSVSIAGLVATFNGVPIGAVLMITGPASEVIVMDDPDGSIEVTLPTAGKYSFEADLFPERSFSSSVNAA